MRLALSLNEAVGDIVTACRAAVRPRLALYMGDGARGRGASVARAGP